MVKTLLPYSFEINITNVRHMTVGRTHPQHMLFIIVVLQKCVADCKQFTACTTRFDIAKIFLCWMNVWLCLFYSMFASLCLYKSQCEPRRIFWCQVDILFLLPGFITIVACNSPRSFLRTSIACLLIYNIFLSNLNSINIYVNCIFGFLLSCLLLLALTQIWGQCLF